MKRSIIIIAGLLVASMAMAADKPVKVNGVTIPPEKIEEAVNSLVVRGQKDTPELRDHIKDQMVLRLVVLQEAQKHHYQNTPEFKRDLDEARKEILIQLFHEDWLKKNPVDAATAQAEYDKQKVLSGSTEYQLAHIAVKTEADAKAVIAELDKGTSFDALVKTKSLDPHGGDDNSSEMWVAQGQLPKELLAAVAPLSKGQYTKKPVQTAQGWFVLRLVGSRPLKAPPFDSVKEQIEQRIQAQRFHDYVTELHDKAKIE